MRDPGDVTVLGVVNTTPDSFSDGGLHLEPAAAIAHGLRLVAAGADLVDVGGESTRPGAQPVDPAEERGRVLPVVAGLVDRGVRVSIDTRHAVVAEAALAAGAALVNDVSGGTADPRMLPLVAAAGVDYVVMHSRGAAAADGGYTDVIADVVHDLRLRVDAALAAGVDPERLVVDPGIGFAKRGAESWALLAHLDAVQGAFPTLRVLVGASRKRFLTDAVPEGVPADRDLATAVLSGLLAQRGIWGLRVHDVAGTRTALAIASRLAGAA